MIIPFFDFEFIKWLVKEKVKIAIVINAWLVIFLLVLQMTYCGYLYFVKPLLLAVIILYILFLFITEYSSFKWLYKLAVVSILFSFIQLVASLLGVGYGLQPTSISKLFWGELAIQCRGGFDDGILLPFRLSGLSKEPGFFSAFLLALFVVRLLDVKAEKGKWIYLLLILGILASFSKITLVFLVAIIILWLINRFIFKLNRINIFVGVFALILFAVLLVSYIYNSVGLIEFSYIAPYFVESYLQRSIGYYILGELSNPEIFTVFLFGGITENLDVMVQLFPFITNLRFLYNQPEVVFFSSGFAYIILQYGIFFFVVLLFLFHNLGFRFYYILILFLLTASVNIFALENYVILSYIILIFAVIQTKKKEILTKSV